MSLHAHVEVLRELRALCDKQNSAYAPALDAAIAALAGGGEAVARFRVINLGPVAPDMEFDWLAEPLDIGSNEWTPLFTHPAGAGQVTDEDIRWLEDNHEALIEAGGSTNNMRAIAVRRAINALNPGGSRE